MFRWVWNQTVNCLLGTVCLFRLSFLRHDLRHAEQEQREMPVQIIRRCSRASDNGVGLKYATKVYRIVLADIVLNVAHFEVVFSLS